MDKRAFLEQLDQLEKIPHAWDLDRDTNTWSAVVGPYTLKVARAPHERDEDGSMNVYQRKSMNVLWSVTHASAGTLIAPTPETVAAYAKREAIAYTRAHLLGQHEPQHAG